MQIVVLWKLKCSFVTCRLATPSSQTLPPIAVLCHNHECHIKMLSDFTQNDYVIPKTRASPGENSFLSFYPINTRRESMPIWCFSRCQDQSLMKISRRAKNSKLKVENECVRKSPTGSEQWILRPLNIFCFAKGVRSGITIFFMPVPLLDKFLKGKAKEAISLGLGLQTRVCA